MKEKAGAAGLEAGGFADGANANVGAAAAVVGAADEEANAILAKGFGFGGASAPPIFGGARDVGTDLFG